MNGHCVNPDCGWKTPETNSPDAPVGSCPQCGRQLEKGWPKAEKAEKKPKK